MTEPALGMRTVYLRGQIAPTSKTHGLVGWLVNLKKIHVGKQVLLEKSGQKGRGNIPKSSSPQTSRNTLSLTAHKQSPAFPPCSPTKIIGSKIHQMDWVGRDL